MLIAIECMKFPTQNIQDVNFIVYHKIMILNDGKILGKIGPIYGTKNAHAFFNMGKGE